MSDAVLESCVVDRAWCGPVPGWEYQLAHVERSVTCEFVTAAKDFSVAIVVRHRDWPKASREELELYAYSQAVLLHGAVREVLARVVPPRPPT